MDRLAITFVIPVRNDARRLDRCLESVFAEIGPSSPDVIVVDNGSSDGSPEVAERWHARVIRKDGNVATVRNAGVAASTAPLIAFIDADHRIEPGWLQAAIDALKSPEVGAVGAPYHTPADGTWVQRLYDGLRRHPERVGPTEWFGAGNLVVRRAAFDAAGGFDTSLEACEDVDLCIRLRKAGWQLLDVPGMRSVHYGDPPTLTRLFWGELWRGRDNIRVSLKAPWSWRNAISMAVPIVELVAIVVGTATMLWSWRLGALFLGGVAALVMARAATIVRRGKARHPAAFAAAVAFAATYDAARALALVTRAPHHRSVPTRRPSTT